MVMMDIRRLGKHPYIVLELLVSCLSLALGEIHYSDLFGTLPVDSPVPEFIPTESNVTYHLGELAILQCSVYNLGTRTVVWRRMDKTFPLTSGTMTVVGDDRIQIGHVAYKNQWDLMIKNVKFEDEGLYECQVSSTDKTMRKTVALTVVGKDLEENVPEIRISEPQYVERGERIHLQCNATGEYYAPDEMDWFRNGERLTSRRNAGVKIFKTYSIAKRTFFSELRVERASMVDDGTYVCRSSNNQIISTKVHVLNAETFNKKRGTLNELKNAVYDRQSEFNSVAIYTCDLFLFISTLLFIIVIH